MLSGCKNRIAPSLALLCEKRIAWDGKGPYHHTLIYPPTRQTEQKE
jgi:hypothetical protein